MSVKHGTSPQSEFMLCGLAFDAYDSGDHDEPIIEAKHGEAVTCPECRKFLDDIRSTYGNRGYKYRNQE